MEQAENAKKWSVEPARVARVAAVLAAPALLVAAAADYGIKLLLALPEGAALSTARVEESAPEAAPEVAPAPRAVAPSRHSFLDPILGRNIFDSTAVGAEASAEGDAGGGERRTDLRVTLLATVVATPEVYSSALIAAGEGRDAAARGYGIGDSLLDEATILRIEQKKVVIKRSDGSIEYLDMGEEGAKSAVASRSSETPAGDEEAGVRQTGEYSWEIDESLIAGALTNIDALISEVRATPHKGPDGQVDGFRLSAIRRGSLLQKLGIKNGDVIHGVNGAPLTSATGAMGAFQSMQSERQFSFDITRRNQKHTFEYTIR